ncbi:hypothetical protein PV10_02620 [Exophiala mesophila]|uniref:Uncharacterized protein n=1 Tax=Exophiala mesophila TaxID=212818 RepID=A0A0D1ZLT3_EXOME|nr:uncharacterized protein PV10_02620 [Exophiala mesophila]KIV94899.1 hypothetical protein PV10_02620 [Exophiala mesophila]
MNLTWSLLLPLALVTRLVASPDSQWASQSNDEPHHVEKYASESTTLESASYPQSFSPHTASPPSVLTYSDGAESQPTQSSEASTLTSAHSSNQESTAVPVPPNQSAFSSEIISSVISVHDSSEQTSTGTDKSIDNRPSISAPTNTNDSPASSGDTQDPATLSAPASARSMTTLSTDHTDTSTASLTTRVTENPEHSLTSQDIVASQSFNGTSSTEADSELLLSGTSTTIESVSSLTSTITSNSVISVTVLLTTFRTVVSLSNGTALAPLTTTTFESPDSMIDSSATLMSSQNTLSSTWPFAGSPVTCDFGLSPSCTYPSSSIPSTAASTSWCLCPYCYLAMPLCDSGPKPSDNDCPPGWLCTISNVSQTTKSVELEVPNGVAWITTELDTWSQVWATITQTNNTKETTSVEWTASISTSTKSDNDGGITLYPFRVWDCVGPLCGDHGRDWFGFVKDCFLSLFCDTHSGGGGSSGNGGWSPPPFPMPPPIAPPPFAAETAATIVKPTPEENKTQSETTSSPHSSTASFSSSLSSSCSETETGTSCDIACSTLTESSTSFESCSTTCSSFTRCSATNTATTSTFGEACTLTPWWKDANLSTQLVSLLTTFPDFDSNDTFAESSVSMGACSDAACVLSQGFTSETLTLSPLTANPQTTSEHTETISSSISVASSAPVTSHIPSPAPTTTSTQVPSTTSTKRLTLSTSTRDGKPMTITSSSRSFSEVQFWTCDGWSVSGSSSCTESFHPASTGITVPPLVELRSACGQYSAPISLTEPAKANQHDCATPVKAAATSTVAHNWDAGLAFQPFRDPKALIAEFCNMLETFELVIVPREPGQDKESQGECHNFYVEPTAEALALYNYRVTVGVMFDYNGCKGPDDKHKEGIDFSKYGSKKCRDNFKDLLVDKCKFSDQFVKDGTNMGPNKWIGGMAWKDCMRWTVIAPDEKFAAPDTLPGLKVPE